MPNRCDVLGKVPSTGHAVSHSHRRTKRQWKVNAHKRRFWLPSERRWVTLWVSTKGLRTIDKLGIERVVADIRARGDKV
jgi:large subunit ribosomal protein L28